MKLSMQSSEAAPNLAKGWMNKSHILYGNKKWAINPVDPYIGYVFLKDDHTPIAYMDGLLNLTHNRLDAALICGGEDIKFIMPALFNWAENLGVGKINMVFDSTSSVDILQYVKEWGWVPEVRLRAACLEDGKMVGITQYGITHADITEVNRTFHR